jgi:RNA polymerase sigma factor (sigma-70 family)
MALTMSKTTRLPAHSEQMLVGAIRAGDDRAFEELYALYRERIFSFILSKVHDHGRAEDIAQEVFMSALRRLRSSDQTISFKPWIYEIAKNACIDEFRRGSRAREVPLESDGEFVVDRQASAVSAIPTPLAAVESKQRLDDLRGAFGGLSSTHHQMLVMREFEGMSYDEIGQRLDMTRQMVESSLFRARRKLSDEYQELASGRRCEQIQTAIDGGRLRAVSGLGLRDRRRFARHLAHCQPCRHAALMAGVDETLLKPRSIAAKIAALLPFPLWRLPWRSKGAKAASTGGSHHLAGTSSAGLVPSAGSAITFGQAAATVAVIIAGAGGTLAVHGLTSGSPRPHRLAAYSTHQASSTPAGGAGSVSASAAKAARRAAALTQGTTAISIGSQKAAAHSTSGRRHQPGSAPGSPGSGTSGGSSGSPTSAPEHGTAGSSSSASGAGTKLVDGVTKTVGGLGKVVTGAGKTVDGVTNGVTTGIDKTVHNVTGGVTQTVNNVTKTVGNVAGSVSGTVSTATNGAVDPGKTVSTVTKVAGSVTSGVTNAGSGAVNGASGAATGAVQKVASSVTGGSGTASPSSSGSSTSSGSGPLPPATSGVSGLVSGIGH